MKLAIVGTGMIVEDLLSIASDLPDVELVAIVGRSPEKLDALRNRHGIRRSYTDYADCLADPEVDTVYVGLPNHLHYGYSRDALLAGKNVICEKPFTLSVAEFDDLAALARERDLILVEAITIPYLANYRALAAALPEVGTVKLVQCCYAQRSSRYDAFRRGETPAAFDPAAGGGAMMDINLYCVHFVVGLLGAPLRATYTANVERGIDTSGVLVLDYGDRLATCVGAKDSAAPNRQIIQGDQGTLVMDGAANTCGPFVLSRPGHDDVRVDKEAHPHRMYEEFVAFTRMINTHDTRERDRRLTHSRTVLDIVLGAVAGLGSAAESGPVR